MLFPLYRFLRSLRIKIVTGLEVKSVNIGYDCTLTFDFIKNGKELVYNDFNINDLDKLLDSRIESKVMERIRYRQIVIMSHCVEIWHLADLAPTRYNEEELVELLNSKKFKKN